MVLEVDEELKADQQSRSAQNGQKYRSRYDEPIEMTTPHRHKGGKYPGQTGEDISCRRLFPSPGLKRNQGK